MSPLRRPPATLDEIVNAELESRRILQRQVAELTGSVDGASGLTSLIDGALGRVGAVETDLAGLDATDTSLAARIAVLESLLTPTRRCRISNSASQSIADDAAAHKLSFDTLISGDASFATALPDVSIDQDGLYIITVCAQFASDVDGDRTLDLYLGDASTTGVLIDRDERRATTGGTCTLNLVTVIGIDAPEILQVWVTQSSGGALNVVSAASFSPRISVAQLFRL